MSNTALPDNFDVVVLGTGLPESILAAACQRIGLSVLHLDRHDFYGGPWASFHLSSFEAWTKLVAEGLEQDSPEPVDQQLIPEGTKFVPIQYESPIRSATCQTLIKDPEPEPTPVETETVEPAEGEERLEGETKEAEAKPVNKPQEWTKETLHKQNRIFSLDLTPKLTLSRGSMVELLVQSGVGRYAEFKVVDRLITLREGQLEQVPCSRSDVFQSTQVTMIEKRKLMKFLTSCLNYEKMKDDLEKWPTFHEYLESQDLTPLLRHFIEDSIAMTPYDITPFNGMKKLSRFLESVGRFGNSPYLWTMFGSGEMPQCFCRLCAVFGGLYCLNRRVDGYLVGEGNKCVGIISEGQRISCAYVIGDAHYFPEVSTKYSSKVICRTILITEKSIKTDQKEHISLLNLRDPMNSNRCVRLLEVSSSGATCPKGLYTVHLTTAVGCDQEVHNAFDFVYDTFFSESQEENCEKVNVLWKASFSYSLDEPRFDSVPSNVLLTHWPDQNIDYESVVAQARKIFEMNWPDESFLPQIPDQPDVEVMDATPDPGINGFAPDANLPDAQKSGNTASAENVEQERTDEGDIGETPRDSKEDNAQMDTQENQGADQNEDL